MPHYKFDPMKELEYLSQRMKKFVEEFPESFSFEFGKGYEPRIDMFHDASAVTVNIEVPGIPRSALSLAIKDGVLTVSGSKKPEYDPDAVTPARMERGYGEFSRQIPLPCEVDADAVAASLRDGVLSVVIPKRAADVARGVDIPIQ
jgi:HSP20 family protein